MKMLFGSFFGRRMKHSRRLGILVLLGIFPAVAQTHGAIANPELKPGDLAYATAWSAPQTNAALAAFQTWAGQYTNTAAEATRQNMVAQGVELARERQAVLAEMVRTDPPRLLLKPFRIWFGSSFHRRSSMYWKPGFREWVICRWSGFCRRRRSRGHSHQALHQTQWTDLSRLCPWPPRHPDDEIWNSLERYSGGWRRCIAGNGIETIGARRNGRAGRHGSERGGRHIVGGDRGNGRRVLPFWLHRSIA